jgi:toxin ParE1/3/4
MKVIYTESALADLDEILNFITINYPTLVDPVQERIEAVLVRLQQWPESAPTVTQRTYVRVAPLIRYPYRIYYRITDETIEIIHIRHTSRRPWGEDEHQN